MKTITSNCVTRRLLLAFFWILVFSGTVNAQNGTYLIWNNEVGCITYDSNGNPNDPRKKLDLFQNVENGPCIRVCEGKSVSYIMNGANIANVQWSASGGTVASVGGPANKNATVNWGSAGNGALNLTITYSNGTIANTTVCIEIINGPKADFKIFGQQEPVFCLDSPINFENTSISNGGSEIVQYQWDFGDGNFSSTFEPTHSYDQPGTYTITLTVTNNCNCSSKYEYTVHIEDKPHVTIDCPSVVCEGGDKQVYTVDDQCGGEWHIEGGHIAAQSATSITVIWDNVDDSGFGTVSYKSSCACPFWTTVKIPVIKKIGHIEGDTILCVNEQGLYTLPQWPSTEFVWTLTPSSASGTHLVYNDQRNQIIVDALAPGNYVLRCAYTNTLLGCGGTAEIKIRVVAGTVITGGVEEICSGASSTYTTTGGGSVQWQMKKNNAVVASSTGVSFTYTFPSGGVYTLTATVGGCPSEPKVINVTQTPSAPTGPLVGETKYCPAIPYDYSFNNTVPNTILEWTVTGGTIQGDNTGNNVTIIYNNVASATITVRRRSLDGMGCLSAPYTVTVNKIVITPTITPNAAGTIFCPSSSTTFNVNLNGNTADLLEWSVIPSNFGNVVSGVNGNTVVVNWNEISNSATGTLRLKIRKCGIDTNYDTSITLQQAPNMVLTAPTQICSGANLNLTLTTPGITTGTITWDFGNGVTETTGISGTTNYSFVNPYNNTTTNNINYVITATLNLPNGCNFSVTATDTILVFPKTIISVTPGYNYTVCPPNYTPFTLTANATTGIGVTVSYQWYKDGGQIPGATSSAYTISTGTQGPNPGGTYYVSVTDSNLCQVKSQNIIVNENCNVIPPCSGNIVPAPNLDVTAIWSDCNVITATATYFGTPVAVQWQGSPFLSLMNGNNTTAQFSTDVPGAHLVTVFATFNLPGGGTCTVQKTVEIEKHYKANFNTTITCNSGTGTYNVSLLNNSTVFDVFSPITYTFTGTGMPAQTGQVINLPNLSPGTYTYTLTLSMANMPNCSITKTITLAPMPSVNFTLNDFTYCAEEPISLTIPNYNPANTYVWNFFNTSYIASSATSLINMNVSASSSQSISLTATNPYGCSFTSTPLLVYINKADLPGLLSVSPSNNVCEGTSPAPVITFIPSGTTPSAYAWMKGNVQVGTGLSYAPTSSGSYWLKSYDVNSCVYTNTPPVTITIRQRPYAGIVGSTNVCSGEQGTIQGIVTNGTLERRWLLGGNPMGAPYGNWSNTTPLNINVPTAPGTYNYTFEVRPANDTGCGSTATTSVTVHAPVVPPTISYTVVSCEPYLVDVVASGPSAGNYNWSNGDVGQYTQVEFGGGLGVTYTAPSGCSASADAMIPEPAERSLWMFPVGCYDVCLTNPTRYIIGPLGVYDHYEWLVNGFIQQSGNNTNVQNLPVNQAGTYQLSIDNDICHYETGIMNIAPNLKECEIIPCSFKAEFKEEIGYENGMYLLVGSIHNTTGSTITVTITSFNNYGVYSPNQVTIAPNGTYNFNTLNFIPNPGYTGGDDFMVLQMPGCMTVLRVKFPIVDGHPRPAAVPAELSIVPNPATEFTVVHYDLGDSFKQAESLIVFDLLGTPLITHKLDKPSGDVEILISNLASGTYIVSIQADGQRAMQQTLLKK